MTYKEYLEKALATATYPKSLAEEYLNLGIHGEIGEVCDKLKKLIRDKGWDLHEDLYGKTIAPEDKKAILLELGDVMWYVANIDYIFGAPYEDADYINLETINTGNVKIGLYDLVIDLSNPTRDYLLMNVNRFIQLIDAIAKKLGSNINEVCRMNNEKLASRMERNKIQGSGDYR